MSEKILLIEDEDAIAESVAYSLRAESFQVEIAEDGLVGISKFRSFSPDLVVLDLMLPKLSGLDFCRIVRKESGVPIIMLTAKTDEIDRVLGLELGADDYVAKPFSVRELVARVRAVLRRSDVRHENQPALLKAGNIQMDVSRRRVTVNEEIIHLPLKQFDLLRALLANRDKVLTREELFRMVWDADSMYDTGSLDVHIRWLREKVETDPGRPQRIRTVRGVGYRIVGESDE